MSKHPFIDNPEVRKQISNQIKASRNLERGIEKDRNSKLPKFFVKDVSYVEGKGIVIEWATEQTSDQYEISRGAEKYIQLLFGLEKFFGYIKKLPPAYHKILDIGAGETFASSQLQKSNLCSNLELEATVLFPNSKIKKNLGQNKTHITPVETLNRIPDESFGGIISVYAAGYSSNPAVAVDSINRVLAPGGAFKGVFPKFENERHGKTTLRTFGNFLERFKELGYDTAEFDGGYEDYDYYFNNSMVILAIKPTALEKNTLVSAAELIKQDADSLEDQVTLLHKEQNAEQKK